MKGLRNIRSGRHCEDLLPSVEMDSVVVGDEADFVLVSRGRLVTRSFSLLSKNWQFEQPTLMGMTRKMHLYYHRGFDARNTRSVASTVLVKSTG
jgi:hypothetical protein